MKAVLKSLGFAPREQKATSHEQWVRGVGGDFRRVTVDCPKAPFTRDLLSMMLHQAGLTRREFHDALAAL